MAKKKKNWNIIVCGDFDNPLAILVPHPAEFTVSDLKKKVSEITNIPENEHKFYFEEEKLEDRKTLTRCGIKNEVALSVVVKPVKISIRHANLGIAVQVKVPKAEFSRWTVKHLHDIVCFNFGLEISPDYILALKYLKIICTSTSMSRMIVL